MRFTFVRLAALCFAAFFVGCREQGAFPQRPIVLLCPWAAGGGTDRVARQLAAQCESELGVPVNVVNATGGAGVTGHTRGAMARPDGYTITLVTPELNMLHWRGLTNITHRDFAPLALVNRDSAALFVRADAPWKTAQELAAAVGQSPGKWKASGTAFGGVWHVALVGWLTHGGLNAEDLIWISINGAAPSLQELLAGGVEVVCCSVAEAQSLLDAKEIRCLAIMADERSAATPDTPTVKEHGVDWSLTAWRGVAAPPGVPTERRRRLAETLQRVVTSEQYLTFMENAGFGAAYEPPDAFREELEASDRQFGEIFRSAAFQSVQRQRFGPMLFPNLLLVLTAVVLTLLTATRGLPRPEGAASISRAGLARLALAPAWVLLYILSADHVGFILAATALTFGMLCALSVRPLRSAAIAILVVSCVYQLFAVHLRVPLPWGWLGW